MTNAWYFSLVINLSSDYFIFANNLSSRFLPIAGILKFMDLINLRNKSEL